MSQKNPNSHRKLAKQLRAARKKHRITTTKLAKAIKVDVETVELLEQGSIAAKLDRPFWMALYRDYAEYVGVKPSQIRVQLGRAAEELDAHVPSVLDTKSSKPLIVLSQQLRRSMILIVTVLVVGYGYWQASVLWSPPKLVLDWPTTDTAVAVANPFVLSGTTSPEATLLIDGDPLPVDTDGTFSTPVYLQQGRNLLTIEVRNNVRGYQKQVLTLYPPTVDLQR